MEFSYKKNDNKKLFTSLVDLQVSQCQNYIPLYEKFFTINDTNCNSIQLNNVNSLQSIRSKVTDNIFNGTVLNQTTDLKEKRDIFFKFSPLLDPIKYLIGKYDISNVNLLNLPIYSVTADRNADSKTLDQNNAAYVDGFFTYLTSQMLHIHGFKHGIDFYGSFLALKNDFSIDVCDDIEYMSESEFFNNNKNILYTIDESQATQFINNNNTTRNCKPKLNLNLNLTTLNDHSDTILLQLSDINDLSHLDTIFNSNTNYITNQLSEADIVYDNVKEGNKNKKDTEEDNDNESRSSCSSRFSDTEDEGEEDGKSDNNDNDNDNDNNDNDKEADSYSETSSSSSCCEDQLFVKIKTFPVQVISLECCEGTLDSLVENDEVPLSDDMWDSIVLQLLMTLIAYQQCFHLTHNDLHSNNIMYMKTSEPFLYYKVDEKYYKVPTYGRIFKIIDFGRAIYKFRGNLMCSDSYHKTGDAAGLYNIEPYFNSKKPRLEPNYSFDLCRLGCSLFDAIVDDISDVDELESPILKIITDWCKDDKGKNIMYKMNGEERYPDFKLYKMIARLVHQHTPLNVLRNKHFNKYTVNKKTMKNAKDKNIEVMNIDELPCYV